MEKQKQAQAKKKSNWPWVVFMLGLGAAAVVFYMYILKPRTTPWSDPTTPTDPGAGIGGGEQHGAQGNSRCQIFQNAAADTKCPSGCCNERGTGQPGWLGSGANQCQAGSRGCYNVTTPTYVAECHGYSCTNQGSVCLQGSPGAKDSTYTCQSGTWIPTTPQTEDLPLDQDMTGWSGTCDTPGSVYFEKECPTAAEVLADGDYWDVGSNPQGDYCIMPNCGGGLRCNVKHKYKMHACCPATRWMGAGGGRDNRWTYMASNLEDPSAINQVCCPDISVSVIPVGGAGPTGGCDVAHAGNLRYVENVQYGERVSEEQFVCNSVGAWHNVTGEALTNNPNGLIFTGCEGGAPPT
jgi:hypothetical protein